MAIFLCHGIEDEICKLRKIAEKNIFIIYRSSLWWQWPSAWIAKSFANLSFYTSLTPPWWKMEKLDRRKRLMKWWHSKWENQLEPLGKWSCYFPPFANILKCYSSNTRAHVSPRDGFLNVFAPSHLHNITWWIFSSWESIFSSATFPPLSHLPQIIHTSICINILPKPHHT